MLVSCRQSFYSFVDLAPVGFPVIRTSIPTTPVQPYDLAEVMLLCVPNVPQSGFH